MRGPSLEDDTWNRAKGERRAEEGKGLIFPLHLPKTAGPNLCAMRLCRQKLNKTKKKTPTVRTAPGLEQLLPSCRIFPRTPSSGLTNQARGFGFRRLVLGRGRLPPRASRATCWPRGALPAVAPSPRSATKRDYSHLHPPESSGIGQNAQCRVALNRDEIHK